MLFCTLNIPGCLFLFFGFVVGCTGGEKPDLPEEISIDAPEGTDANPYPQEVNIVSTDEGDYALVEVRGYLHGTVEDCWTHLRDPKVFINHREIDEYNIEEDSSDTYAYLYQIHLVVHDIVTVEYDHEWRHSVVSGSQSSPESVQVDWEKVAGSTFISLQEGSISFFDVAADSDVVELQIIYQLAALQNQEQNARQYMEDLYANWYAAVNGETIPSY